MKHLPSPARVTLCSFAMLVALLSLASFASAQQAANVKNESRATNAPPDFRLSPGDAIEVKFFYNKELNDTVQLRPDGYISLQLVGEIGLGGKTIAEATRTLERSYEEYLHTPSVTIEVRAYSSRKIFVGGEVERPGVLALSSETTLLAAVIEAGGVKRGGDRGAVLLIRRGEDGRPVMSKISLHNKREGRGGDNLPSPAAQLALQPFDVVLVPETRIARLNKWVDQYIRQMSPLTLTGGFSYFGGGVR